jgi:transcriptional regulator of acetoin/glycerol metabolism
VQHQLLRVLESGEVQPVGGELCRVDVRVLAATDSALEGRLGSDDFSGPLYFRIARTRLHIEPLRLRPADIAVQLVHFLERELRSCGAEAVLDPGRRSPWLALDVLQAALAHSWPGNTRELIGVAADLVDRFQKQPCCGLPRFAVSSPSPWESQRSAEPRDELELALRAHAFRLGPTARALGITVPTLHRRMAAHGFVRAHELQVERIREELAKSGSVGEAAATLCVSKHALKIRMNVLGLEA